MEIRRAITMGWMALAAAGLIGGCAEADGPVTAVNELASARPAERPDAGAERFGPAIDVHCLRHADWPTHPSYGARVEVRDLVVTGVKERGAERGFFAQHRTRPSWGGVFVFVGEAAPAVAPGDVIAARGVFASFGGFDRIDVRAGAVERLGRATVPAPIEVALADVAEGGARVEELQAVYVEVRDVVATRATAGVDFAVGADDDVAPRELVVTSFVAADLDPSPFVADRGQRYAAIRGVGYRAGEPGTYAIAKLAPFGAHDVFAR